MKIIRNLLYGLTLFLQMAGVIALFVAEKLTHKKAGVNHHLYYRRAQFNSTVLTQDRILVLTGVLLIAIAALLFLLWKRRGMGKLLKVSCVLETGWLAITLAACHMNFFRSTYVYPYMMAVFTLGILLSGLQILLSLKK